MQDGGGLVATNIARLDRQARRHALAVRRKRERDEYQGVVRRLCGVCDGGWRGWCVHCPMAVKVDEALIRMTAHIAKLEDRRRQA